jgi:hypothetical protein
MGALPITHEYAERDRELGERREASRRGITFLKPSPAEMTYRRVAIACVSGKSWD